MIKLLLGIILTSTLITVIGFTQTTYAVPASLKQQILPLDCVFQVINDGSNTVVYLTPAQCGQIIDIPPTTGGETPIPTPIPTVFTRVETGNGVVEFPFLPGATSSSSRLADALGNAPYLPYAPLSTLKDQDKAQQLQNQTVPFDLSSVPAPVAAISVITLFLIVLFFFL